MVATTAAVGAVATGTFTALVPTPEDGTATAAAADGPYDAVLAAETTALDPEELQDAVLAVLPVELASKANPVEDHLERLVQAVEIAELHAQQAREQAERERLEALIKRGGLDGWIAEALQLMDLPQSLAPSVKKIIMKESGGNPRAVNNWDSNARRGTPSQGLMQTIPSTFEAYVHPSLKGCSIMHPVANITAGVRYMIDKYGMATLEAGGRTNSSGGYVGY